MRAEQHQDSKNLLQNQPINDLMKKEKHLPVQSCEIHHVC